MSDSTIGIKLANGAYYPILREGSTGRKKLVLTTVKDNQSSVQIDLYRGKGEEIEEAVYIGSLVIEDIELGKGGDPDIELIVGLDNEGNLNATASDEATGDKQSLSVSLESLDEQGMYEIPEFDLDENLSDDMDSGAESAGGDFTDGGLGQEESRSLYPSYSEPEKPNTLKLVLFTIAGLVLLVLLVFLFSTLIRGCSSQETPPLQAQGEQATPAAVAADPVRTPVPTPVRAAPTVAAVAAQPSLAPEGPEGMPGMYYTIRWGDTLWDLSASFYRNPWLYPNIAKVNKIRNPDLIYAGNDLFIPQDSKK